MPVAQTCAQACLVFCRTFLITLLGGTRFNQAPKSDWLLEDI
ncbi:hypothetical protein [Helicobacter felis]|nr:hypothetical protein [Helicobacter felis]